MAGLTSKINARQAAGFTLIEVVVVMGLFGLIAAFTIITNIDSYRSSTFHSERSLAISALQRARSQAINNACFGAACTDGLPHGVHIDTDAASHITHYVIFQGATYNPGDPLNEVLEASGQVSLNIPSFEVIFQQLSGEAATNPPTWSANLYDNVGHSSSIQFNSQGRIAWDN